MRNMIEWLHRKGERSKIEEELYEQWNYKPQI